MAAGATPTQLDLVDRWAQVLGMTTRRTSGTDSGGRTIPGLEIHRGQVVIIAFSPEAKEPFVVLKVFANIPPALRATVGRLAEDSRRELTEAIYVSLQSNPRSGYQVIPQGAADFSQMEQISIEQVVRVSDGDASSFNRLMDAFQELSTGLIALGRHVKAYVTGPEVSSSSAVRGEGASAMFR